jgi:hypothetical protein
MFAGLVQWGYGQNLGNCRMTKRYLPEVMIRAIYIFAHAAARSGAAGVRGKNKPNKGIALVSKPQLVPEVRELVGLSSRRRLIGGRWNAHRLQTCLKK